MKQEIRHIYIDTFLEKIAKPEFLTDTEVKIDIWTVENIMHKNLQIVKINQISPDEYTITTQDENNNYAIFTYINYENQKVEVKLTSTTNVISTIFLHK